MNYRLATLARPCILALCVSACAAPDDRPPPARRPGTIALGERIVVPSPVLDASRTALVHLPDGYPGDGSGYPVIIVLDGESHFLTAASAARFLARAGLMPDAIIVGIENTNRERDFTTVATHPAATPNGLGETGGAAAFATFIENELIPALDERYRTAPARVMTLPFPRRRSSRLRLAGSMPVPPPTPLCCSSAGERRSRGAGLSRGLSMQLVRRRRRPPRAPAWPSCR